MFKLIKNWVTSDGDLPFKDSIASKDFYSYVTGIPNDELMNVFINENNKLLGKSGLKYYKNRTGDIEIYWSNIALDIFRHQI